MERFLSSWFVSSVALGLAALILGDKMNVGESDETALNRVLALAAVGLVFSIVHVVVGPIVKLLSLPFIILTLGLFLVLINALLLLLTEWITTQVGVHFEIASFSWALLAAVVVAIGQSIVGAIVGD